MVMHVARVDVYAPMAVGEVGAHALVALVRHRRARLVGLVSGGGATVAVGAVGVGFLLVGASEEADGSLVKLGELHQMQG